MVIPAYNKADHTVEAVESVLSQTYKNIECIVVDDGSTDDTFYKLFPYKIKYLYQDNGGVSVARNCGIVHSKGEYVGFLDCDDLYLEHKVSVSLAEMDRQGLDMIYSGAFYIDETGNPKGMYNPKKSNLLFRNSIINLVIMKKSIFKEIGMFDEELFVCADWDMWLRVEEKFNVGYVDLPLGCYRI